LSEDSKKLFYQEEIAMATASPRNDDPKYSEFVGQFHYHHREQATRQAPK
jgi:hypothetical protein